MSLKCFCITYEDVTELACEADLKSAAFGRGGSSPLILTIFSGKEKNHEVLPCRSISQRAEAQ